MPAGGKRITMRQDAPRLDDAQRQKIVVHPPQRPSPRGADRNMTTTPMPVLSTPRQGRERRAWPRFPRLIRVLLLAEDCALDEPYGGWIIETSRGGVRLRVSGEPFPVGTLLQIRGPFASARVPWTGVRVKHLRHAGSHWELGCEFINLPTSDTVRLGGPTRIQAR